jgi:hypothetical protein
MKNRYDSRRWLRLAGLTSKQLPAGSTPLTTDRREPKKDIGSKSFVPERFAGLILGEADRFLEKVGDSESGWVAGAEQTLPGCSEPVKTASLEIPGRKFLFRRRFGLARTQGEFWVSACTTLQPLEGQADMYAAVYHAFKMFLADAEAEMTPNLTTTVVSTWNLRGNTAKTSLWDRNGWYHVKATKADGDGRVWSGLTMTVVEMRYSIDEKGVRERVFPVLQVTAELRHELGTLREGEETKPAFVVVHVPLKDYGRWPQRSYKGRWKTVEGRYASVQRFVGTEDGSVEWTMARAVDPKGFVPASLRKKILKQAVPERVDQFIKWFLTRKERGYVFEMPKEWAREREEDRVKREEERVNPTPRPKREAVKPTYPTTNTNWPTSYSYTTPGIGGFGGGGC